MNNTFSLLPKQGEFYNIGCSSPVSFENSHEKFQGHWHNFSNLTERVMLKFIQISGFRMLHPCHCGVGIWLPCLEVWIRCGYLIRIRFHIWLILDFEEVTKSIPIFHVCRCWFMGKIACKVGFNMPRFQQRLLSMSKRNGNLHSIWSLGAIG